MREPCHEGHPFVAGVPSATVRQSLGVVFPCKLGDEGPLGSGERTVLKQVRSWGCGSGSQRSAGVSHGQTK